MMPRASSVRCSCPWRVKPISPMTHLPCFDFELGDEHRLRELARHRVRSRPSEETATNRQGEAARNLNLALRQSQMDIFDFILIFPVTEASELFHVDGFYGGTGVWYYYFPVAVPPFSLVNSGLPERPGAVQGPKRRSGPWTARTDLES